MHDTGTSLHAYEFSRPDSALSQTVKDVAALT